MISITNYLIILIKYTLINKLLFWVIVSLLVYTCQALKYFHCQIHPQCIVGGFFKGHFAAST